MTRLGIEKNQTIIRIECKKTIRLTVICTFLHLKMKYSGTISMRAVQQFEPLTLVKGELGDGIDDELKLT